MKHNRARQLVGSRTHKYRITIVETSYEDALTAIELAQQCLLTLDACAPHIRLCFSYCLLVGGRGRLLTLTDATVDCLLACLGLNTGTTSACAL